MFFYLKQKQKQKKSVFFIAIPAQIDLLRPVV